MATTTIGTAGPTAAYVCAFARITYGLRKIGREISPWDVSSCGAAPSPRRVCGQSRKKRAETATPPPSFRFANCQEKEEEGRRRRLTQGLPALKKAPIARLHLAITQKTVCFRRRGDFLPMSKILPISASCISSSAKPHRPSPLSQWLIPRHIPLTATTTTTTLKAVLGGILNFN